VLSVLNTAAVVFDVDELTAIGSVILHSGGTTTIHANTILTSSLTEPAIIFNAGKLIIEGGTIEADSDFSVHYYILGSLLLSNVRIFGQLRAQALGATGVIIKDAVIVTDSANSIISSPGPSIVRNYGQSMSNKAVSGDITFATGTTHYEVDTDVVFV
jgi:hypothetical protein